VHLRVFEGVLAVDLHQLFEREFAQLDIWRGLVGAREILLEILTVVMAILMMVMVVLALGTVFVTLLLHFLQLSAHFEGLFMQRLCVLCRIVLFVLGIFFDVAARTRETEVERR